MLTLFIVCARFDSKKTFFRSPEIVSVHTAEEEANKEAKKVKKQAIVREALVVPARFTQLWSSDMAYSVRSQLGSALKRYALWPDRAPTEIVERIIELYKQRDTHLHTVNLEGWQTARHVVVGPDTIAFEIGRPHSHDPITQSRFRHIRGLAGGRPGVRFEDVMGDGYEFVVIPRPEGVDPLRHLAETLRLPIIF